MSFQEDNEAYETWLREQCTVVEEDLDFKHKKMKKDAFTFLRATYFRWAGTIEAICPELAEAPAILSVGDTHLENFGTWRDAEGRLVWGVNDLDEAAVMPYPFDLVRLLASVRLAPDMEVSGLVAAEAILKGYREALNKPRPTLLDEQETWMRPFVACSDEDRERFWEEIQDYPTAAASPPAVTVGLARSLPPGAVVQRFATRRKGSGGLGRPRYVAIAAWRGGHIAREAKALVPSAWDWAHGTLASPSRFLDVACAPFRSPDPFLACHGGYVIRRISADARKVEFADDTDTAPLKIELLEAMGFDLGSIHAAEEQKAAAVREDFDQRPAGWLRKASKAAAGAVEGDYHGYVGPT
jgi:hypothetical protein